MLSGKNGYGIRIIPFIFTIAVFWLAGANFTFFSHLLHEYPLDDIGNIAFVLSLLVGFLGVVVIVLILFCHRYTTKPIVISLLLGAAFSAYFMDSYNVFINEEMIGNTINSDIREINDLLSLKLFLYLFLLGIIPSLLVYRAKIYFAPFKKEIITRSRLIAGMVSVIGVLFLCFSASTSSFFREHTVRFYFNPSGYVFALGDYGYRYFRGNKKHVVQIGTDAEIPKDDIHRELVIMVVGETARADHFSLNGYKKKTNPLLEKEKVVSFTNFKSCGTSTLVSVPCMFSIYGMDNYDGRKIKTTENALDILQHAGVNVLWRDNNSSSKGVANRVPYQDFRDPLINPVCDVECRDVGMLSGLQEYIDSHSKGDIIIVLHQMGNHGPAYYKRYPQEFERFKPICKTNELSDCSIEEITNAYDNAVLYTDYFLSKTIDLLKKNDDKFETMMFYVSDHGESLGENGIYLHGMPNIIAPEAQRHVPAIVWLGRNFDEISFASLKTKTSLNFSHDNIFPTLLGLMEIKSNIYDASKNIFYDNENMVSHAGIKPATR